MLYLLDHLGRLVLIGLALWLPGRGLATQLSVETESRSLLRIAELVLGFSWWTLGAVMMATLGVLQVGAAFVWLALGLVLNLRALSTGLRLRSPEAQSPGSQQPQTQQPQTQPPQTQSPQPLGWRDLVPALVILALVLPLILLAASPQVSWDADVYHLTLPRLYLEAQGFRNVEMSVYSNWPLGVQMLYAMAMMAGDYVLAKLLHCAIGLSILFLLVATLRGKAQHSAMPWIAGLLFLGNGVVFFELRVAYVDLALAFFLLAAFLLVHKALEDPKGRRTLLLLAGLACGLMAGAKVNGIVGVVMVSILTLPLVLEAARKEQGRPAAVALGLALCLGLPTALFLLPWVAKAAWFTGNPVYPFLSAWLPAPDWSLALSESFGAWQRSIGMGRDLVDYALLPVRVILEGGQGYDRFDGSLGPYWIVVIPLALLAIRQDALTRRALLVAALYFVAWAASSQQVRFLIPVLPLLAIAGARAGDQVLARLPARWRAPSGWFCFVGLALFLFISQHQVLQAGLRLPRIYQRGAAEIKTSVVPEVFGYVAAELQPDAKLLFLNTNRGFFCPREYLADSFFEASQIADWLKPAQSAAEVRALLSQRGVTHILLERVPRVAYPNSLMQLLADPAAVEVRFRSQDQRHVLLELKGASQPKQLSIEETGNPEVQG